MGIGEDGVEGVPAPARDAVRAAALVYGGARHLALADGLVGGRARVWARPIEASLDAIVDATRDGVRVAVLASGDPFCFGVGSLLAARLEPGAWVAWPGRSSVSLACGVLGWASDSVRVVSLCGRPVGTLLAALAPGARILALSADEDTPDAVARLLREAGHGGARLYVMERLGGPLQRVRTMRAGDAVPDDVARLNLVAIELEGMAADGALPLAPGLADDRFAHDGQLTRAELRAMAIAALAPRPGEVLWDVGAGAGSVAIEWARCGPGLRAVAFERDPARGTRLLGNAASLGVGERVRLVGGEAPGSFPDEGAPDAVFVGGGGRTAMLEAAWARLRAGGRLVAHAVTVETELALLDAAARLGGSVVRVGMERLDRIGGYRAFRPAMTVTQYAVTRGTEAA